MNDRTINILEKYDMTISRTFKGRGSIICESDKGLHVLKPYKGNIKKLELLNHLQQNISNNIKTDSIVRNKEGSLFVKDTDGTTYILKEYADGRECNYKSDTDVAGAFMTMARLHKDFTYIQQKNSSLEDSSSDDILSDTDEGEMPICFYYDEMEKHTKECKHVKNYLKKLNVKADFERTLLKEYDYFLNKAEDITRQAKNESRQVYESFVRDKGLYCHGDFQYHNVLFPANASNSSDDIAIVNFEHFVHDSGVRDFYLLFRKISEKSEWSIPQAQQMLDAYQGIRRFSDCEWKALGLRLAYPEKFWKIINFYYNSRKSWIPARTFEKLENLVRIEKNKEKLIQTLFL